MALVAEPLVVENSHDADRVGDLSVDDHLKCFGKGKMPKAEHLGALRVWRPCHEICGEKDGDVLIGDRIGEVGLSKLKPMVGGQAGLLAQLASGRLESRLTLRTAPLRDLPGVAVERQTVLPDQPGLAAIVDGQYADGAVAEMDDPVDAWLAVWSDHLLMCQADPGIFIDDFPGDHLPRTLCHSLLTPFIRGRFRPGR